MDPKIKRQKYIVGLRKYDKSFYNELKFIRRRIEKYSNSYPCYDCNCDYDGYCCFEIYYPFKSRKENPANLMRIFIR